MRKKTQKRPIIFEYNGDTFKAERLGHLEAGMLMYKYVPHLMKLKDIKPEEGSDSVDLAVIFNTIPVDIIKQAIDEILVETYVQNEEGVFEKLDPEEFSDFKEQAHVMMKVVQFNFPDFFPNGAGTEAVIEVPVKEPQKLSPPETQTPVVHQL